MSLQQLAAQRMAAQGRGPDTQLVHMSPREVAGLQALAMAQGGSLTINPETGLPEAGFLDSMLPMILGIGAMALTGGAAGAAMPGLFGMGMPATIGLGVGALQTARTGSLEKGLMAGLGAYGGAGLAGGLMAAGGASAANAANAAAAAESMGGALAADQAALAGMNAGAPAMAGITNAASAAPTLAADAGTALMQDQAGLAAIKAAPTIAPVPPTIPPAAAQPSFGEGFKQLGRGFSAITEPGGFDAFMGKAASKGVEATGIGGGMGLLKYGAAAAAPLLVSDTKTKMPAEDNERYNYRFDAGRTEEGYVDPVTGTRQYFRPTYTRYAAAGGPVEDMSMSNVYDMQNARGGVSDMGIDNSTGMQRMAGGGITGSGELNLNIPLNFGGGGGGGFGGGFNQGPLDLGQNRTGFGQSAANGYQPVGSGALSSPPGFLAPKPSSTVGLTENPFNLGTQLASRLGSANQNPFAAQPTPEMMAAQRGESLVNPVISQISQADLQRLAEAGQARAYEQYLSGFGKNTPTYESQVAKASAGGQTLPISREKYEQQVANAVPMTRQEYDQRMKQANMGFAPLAHVLQPGTAQYDNYMKNRGPSNQFERFADGGMAGGGISHLGDYSDGGRLLRGPGDGVSDSIPAMIGRKQPARLADGEFVVPARIVSELGNGSTEAGARKLYAMMDRVQKARGKTTGKGRVAKNTRAEKYLPA